MYAKTQNSLFSAQDSELGHFPLVTKLLSGLLAWEIRRDSRWKDILKRHRSRLSGAFLKLVSTVLCASSVGQLCSALCDFMGCSPPGSSAHGIFQQEYWSRLPFPTPSDLPVGAELMGNLCSTGNLV